MTEVKPTDQIPFCDTDQYSCFIRMENAPYEFIYIQRVEEGKIIYNSRASTEQALVLRHYKAAERFISEHNLIGYKPILVTDMYPNSNDLN